MPIYIYTFDIHGHAYTPKQTYHVVLLQPSVASEVQAWNSYVIVFVVTGSG